MATIKTSLYRFGLLSICASSGLAGCGDGDAPQPLSSSPDQANIVFEAAYSKDGRFRVSEARDGTLMVSLIGKTGVDDPDKLRVFKTSLVETYRALKPDESAVPEVLTRLDERFARQLAEADRGRARTPASEPKDAITFLDRICHQITLNPSWKIVVNHCRYRTAVNPVCTDWSVDSGDVVFSQNDTSGQTATVKEDFLGDSGAFGWLSAGSWGWFFWGGAADQRTCQYTHNGSPGDMGISHHDTVAAFP
jgi:hypothetical protein